MQTASYGLHYPSLADPPNVPADMQRLAESVAAALGPVDARTRPGHLIASRTRDLPLPAGGWQPLAFDVIDSAHDAALNAGNPQLTPGWWNISIEAQIRIADGGSGYISWAGGPFAGSSSLTDGYAGISVSRLTAITGEGHIITARAKASGKTGTLVFARFSAFRTTAPNPAQGSASIPPSLFLHRNHQREWQDEGATSRASER
jgi:hypothetical protein